MVGRTDVGDPVFAEYAAKDWRRASFREWRKDTGTPHLYLRKRLGVTSGCIGGSDSRVIAGVGT
jgi:hypothetical protein